MKTGYEAPINTAGQLTYPDVAIDDGHLNLSFRSVRNNPMVSAIEVKRQK